MKIAFLLSIFACAALAQEPAPTTIETINHVKYEQAVVRIVEPDAITIRHSAGVARVPFEDLSAEMQKQYGYDAKKAAAYRKMIADAERDRIAAEARAIQSAAQAKARENNNSGSATAHGVAERDLWLQSELEKIRHKSEIRAYFDRKNFEDRWNREPWSTRAGAFTEPPY